MAELHIVCEYGKSGGYIVVNDEDEYGVVLDLAQTVEEGDRSLSLMPSEARALAAALLHFAQEKGSR